MLTHFSGRAIQSMKLYTISSSWFNDQDGQQQWIIKPNGLFNLQPKKTIICEAQAIKAEKVINSKKMENKEGCSSEKERKVNALALRADEGRDYLR